MGEKGCPHSWGQSQLARTSASLISCTHTLCQPSSSILMDSFSWFHPLCLPYTASLPPSPAATSAPSLLYRDSINPTFPRWYRHHSGFPPKLICPDKRPKDWSPGITWHIPFKPSTIINRKLIRTVLKDHTEERPRIGFLGGCRWIRVITGTPEVPCLIGKQAAWIHARCDRTAAHGANLIREYGFLALFHLP